MEERLEMRQQILEDVQSKSFENHPVEGRNTAVLQLQLKESEHVGKKLSQTVSDLTVALNLKEAELRYWQSRASLHRQEALALAKGSKSLKESLSELEYMVECQTKELTTLREERARLTEALEQACTEKERLLQRWMEEKSEDAERLNRYNDTQERWHHLTKQMKKQLKKETRTPSEDNTFVKEPFSSDTSINSTTDAPQEL
ncbi:autophagy-related protein 16 [Gouania willdenowi]|uniref:autophagy-related protein 16 n=1 Tax=Gouania willdenowi TaxID=441366 RepID=UPI0010553F09|nr:autophagy-related protein 16-like [Gouania willdenowi]